MIEEVEPDRLNDIENYLYFDDSQEEMMEEDNIPGIGLFVDNVDLLESMTNQDFSKLLSGYSLNPSTKHAYEIKFQKAKRIYKRDKAKTRTTAPCLKLLQPLIETSESVGVKIEYELTNDKDCK